jgi:hypothetical protein
MAKPNINRVKTLTPTKLKSLYEEKYPLKDISLRDFEVLNRLKIEIPKDWHILPIGSMIIESDKALIRSTECRVGGKTTIKWSKVFHDWPGNNHDNKDVMIIRMNEDLLKLRLELLQLQLKLKEKGIRY